MMSRIVTEKSRFGNIQDIREGLRVEGREKEKWKSMSL
jgi:hypothetical protein